MQAQGVGSPLPTPLTSRSLLPQVLEAGATGGPGGRARAGLPDREELEPEKKGRGAEGFVSAYRPPPAPAPATPTPQGLKEGMGWGRSEGRARRLRDLGSRHPSLDPPTRRPSVLTSAAAANSDCWEMKPGPES